MAEAQDSLLTGYRVLDLTYGRGFLCGKVLGDLGADVIKIEPPQGDPTRSQGPFYKDKAHPERSLFWWWANLNKRGITLNLETPDGRELLKRLVQRADVLVESFEPGYLDGLGLGYQVLEEINPRLILTSITPFGQTGPYAHYKAPDLVGMSLGGMVRLFGEMDRPPNRISAPQFDFLGGLHGAVGSMVALYERELSGRGQRVDVSCQQAVVLALMIAAETWDLLKFNYRGTGPYGVRPRPTPPGPLMARLMWPVKDGHVLLMLGGGAQAGFVKSSTELVKMANAEGMALELKGYDWATIDVATITQEEIDQRQGLIGAFLRTRTKAELLQAAVEREILIIPASDARDVVESPQLKARGFWAQVEHPEVGETITYPGFPVQWSELPPYRPQRRAPQLGEHNEEVYIRELGLRKEDLVLLKNQGVI